MIIATIRTFIALALICCLVYPALLLAFAGVVNPSGAEGSLLRDEDGTIRGSRLIAQDFSQPRYFWPRPSAVDFDGGGAGGSNLSPAGEEFRLRVTSDLDSFGASPDQPVPIDLVTTSGSGLDPHISHDGALYQANRIALDRGLTVEDVQALIAEFSEPVPGFGAGTVVNVLMINRALDSRWPVQEDHEQP